jgi:mono/diheme cytochrome c family protein
LRDAVSPDFVRTWLTDPGKLLPSHRMPTFRLQSQQIEALLAFLWSVPGPALAPLPSDLSGDGERGKKAVAARRCATCHRIDGRGGEVGPDLALAGMKLQPAWIYTLLLDTHRLRPHTQMPGFQLDRQEAMDIATYAGEDWLADSGVAPWKQREAPVQPALAEQGKKLFGELGCAGCHRLGGPLGEPIAPALDRLGDRLVVDLPKTSTGTSQPDVPSWVALKLQVPTAFDQKGAMPSRMPTMPGLAPADALAIGTALASLRAQPLPAGYLRNHDPPERRLPAGETGRLIDRFRCLVCHTVGGHGGEVAKVALDGAGSRLNRAWIESFLQSPVTVRMNQAERMPVLGITGAQAQQLAAWLQGSQGDDRVPLAQAPTPTADLLQRGAALYAKAGCPTCHVAAGSGTMQGPTLDGCAVRLQVGYVQTLLTMPELVPAARHTGVQLSPGDAAAVAAYVLGLPAAPSP